MLLLELPQQLVSSYLAPDARLSQLLRARLWAGSRTSFLAAEMRYRNGPGVVWAPAGTARTANSRGRLVSCGTSVATAH